MKILVTCPPMLGRIDTFRPLFEAKNVELVAPKVVQTLSEEELMGLLPDMDGWIIGDDPATERVFTAGRQGKLRAAVKWGVGVDNVNFEACKKLGIPVTNTPGMFGEEVADMAIGYLIGLAREMFLVDRGVRSGQWLKPPGMSLSGTTAALIGFGDIGRAVGVRLEALGMKALVYDPHAAIPENMAHCTRTTFPEGIETADFVMVTCSLTPETRHLINRNSISLMKDGVRIINVSRGPIIDETALVEALISGKVHSAGLDVFEQEPLPADSPLRNFERCIFGTHNGSNTVQAVHRTSIKAIQLLFDFLGI
ncbi:MAG: phosphoglycerate dehydrogenase [Saprospiraceae bacterium]|nr:phosphoglycerate dehydrogenase [Saprospiraceae bacterium]MDZ4704608.1 phosphoglycerate dehydrogenase [Saprospiraceae bacterium]